MIRISKEFIISPLWMYYKKVYPAHITQIQNYICDHRKCYIQEIFHQEYTLKAWGENLGFNSNALNYIQIAQYPVFKLKLKLGYPISIFVPSEYIRPYEKKCLSVSDKVYIKEEYKHTEIYKRELNASSNYPFQEPKLMAKKGIFYQPGTVKKVIYNESQFESTVKYIAEGLPFDTFPFYIIEFTNPESLTFTVPKRHIKRIPK